MEWINIKTQSPTKEDFGKEFLVAVKMASRYEYQVAEWVQSLYQSKKGTFLIQQGWCGQQMVKRTVTHWIKLPELPKM